jgi:perosamine synthetase
MEPRPAILGGKKIIDENDARFIWPKITDKTIKALLEQLKSSISIYDRSGIFETFENEFANYHNRKYALLSNSGTSAIFSMFEGIDLRIGDEVICPVYTFHASVSPLMYLGAVPIFCDCDESGSITVAEIIKRRSAKTKAVVVTHMWGSAS